MLPGILLVVFAELCLLFLTSHRRSNLQQNSMPLETTPLLSFPQQSIQLLPQHQWGIVEIEILPDGTGRVQFQATSWPARFYHKADQALQPGQRVAAIALQGNTLLVMPIQQPAL